jgi:hypothetical protein
MTDSRKICFKLIKYIYVISLILCLIASSVLTSLGFCSFNKRENNNDVHQFLTKFYGVDRPNSNLASYERQDDKKQSEL